MIAAGFFGASEVGAGGGAGDPFWASVQLLAPFEGADGATTFPEMTGATLTGGGGAHVSTTRNAAGALVLDGVTAGSRVSSNRNSAIGAGAFTLEAFIRPTVAQVGRIIGAQDSSSSNALIWIRTNADGSLTGGLRNSSGAGLALVSSAAALVAMNDTAEYHVAFTRDGSGNCTVWLNGASVATAVSSTNPDGSWPWIIGGFGSSTQERFAGYIRWARVTNACRYTGPFSPPAPPFPTS